MKKTTLLTRLPWLLIPLLLIGLIGFAAAKYINTYESGTYTVTFTAELAKDFILQEHEIIRNDDGSYKLATKDHTADGEEKLTTDSQTYELIPGLDIPKDPHVVITGKTDIPAYLYIEIVESLDSAKINGIDTKLIDYTVASCWKAVDTSVKAPQHGGTVYVYTDGTSEQNPVVLDDKTEGLSKINILEGNTVFVSQHVKSYGTEGTDGLTFYAYLIEVT